MGLGWPLLSRVQCSALYAVGPSTVAAAAFFTVVDFNADCTEKVASSGKPIGTVFSVAPTALLHIHLQSTVNMSASHERPEQLHDCS